MRKNHQGQRYWNFVIPINDRNNYEKKMGNIFSM